MRNGRLKLWAAEFTLALGCKLNCKYCPQKLLIKRYYECFNDKVTQMTFETFKTVLDKVEEGAGIAFGGMVEPFQNPECSRMIRYAHEKGYKVHLDTTLQGATLEDLQMLEGVTFNGVQLHVPDEENNAHFVLSDEWLKVFQKFNAREDVDAYHCHGTVHPLIRDELFRERKFSNTLMNRAGNLSMENLKEFQHEGRIVCQNGGLKVFGSWVPDILPNGTAILCCMDYGLEHILGNLVSQSWADIIKGDAYLQVEKGMDDDTIPLLCRTCHAACERDRSIRLSEINVLGPNAVKIWRLLNEDSLAACNAKIRELINRIRMAKIICVFGLGKLFHDNYFQSGWHNVIPADIFSDNDQNKWGTYIHGVQCVPPEDLQGKEAMLVITYVKNDVAIRTQLKEMGISNVINVYDVFNLRDSGEA